MNRAEGCEPSDTPQLYAHTEPEAGDGDGGNGEDDDEADELESGEEEDRYGEDDWDRQAAGASGNVELGDVSDLGTEDAALGAVAVVSDPRALAFPSSRSPPSLPSPSLFLLSPPASGGPASWPRVRSGICLPASSSSPSPLQSSTVASSPDAADDVPRLSRTLRRSTVYVGGMGSNVSTL